MREEKRVTAKDKAQSGLALMKTAILEYLAAHPGGARNAEITQALGLDSDFEGEQKDYLAWSVLGLLLGEGKVRYERIGRHREYFPV